MKQRSSTAATANEGVNALLTYCNHFGLIFQAEPREDFGIDCYLEVAFDNWPQNFIVGAQVKSGPSYRREHRDGTFSINVRRDDVSYWLAANYPVLFVYYHEKTGLYFRHVQYAFDGAQAVSECTSLTFAESDRAADDAMAKYVRRLARVTPSIINRFEVLTGQAGVMIGRKSLPLIAAMPSAALAFDKFRTRELDDLQARFPIYPRVLGYSYDGRWVCELHVPDPGPRGFIDATVSLLDLEAQASVQFCLFTGDELEAAEYRGVPFDWERYDRTLDRLNDIIRVTQVEEARTLYEGYELALQAEERSPVGITFGNEAFDLDIGTHEGRDALLLCAGRYTPPRRTPILIERAPFAYTMIPEGAVESLDDLMRLETAATFEFLAGVSSSASGKLLTIAVMTNDTHGCWGTRTVHLSHHRVADLRAACADSLRH